MWAQRKKPLSDDPWPVAAKAILTNREQELYRALHSLYPEYRILVQVALSQLVDVPEDHPDRMSIRGHFKQLVADFVLCRADLSVVAVIELDDRSHECVARKDADARKTKALCDAGLKLIRIPAGNLPSPDCLRKIIDSSLWTSANTGKPTAAPKLALFDSVLGLNEKIQTFEISKPVDSLKASRALRRHVLKMVFLPLLLLLGWFAYIQIIPHMVKLAFQSFIPKPPVAHVISPPILRAAPVHPTIATLPATPPPSPAANQSSAFQAAAELTREKNRAWLAYYAPPPSCEHPVDWSAQVECGNKYMRAKMLFEQQWAKDHDLQTQAASVPIIDNH